MIFCHLFENGVRDAGYGMREGGGLTAAEYNMGIVLRRGVFHISSS